MQISLTEQFKQELFRPNLNVPELDGVACTRCGEVPPVVKKKLGGKLIVDRTSRIDCDKGEKKEKLETFCKDCWQSIVTES